ncbi:MAG TPA: tetratricopeptide repeat protein [Candidatus Obscuribacterales bacterium]
MSLRVWLSVACTLISSLCLSAPAFAGYDAFELPPNVEQTIIPKRLPGSDHFGVRRVDPADLAAIDRLRANIERLYAQNNYEMAEPLYRQYVTLVEKVAPDDNRVAYALQNYADLLQRLGRYGDAQGAESRAQGILDKNNVHVEPFSLKQYKLGMTLDEFRKLEPPGVTGKVKTTCSCDQGQNAEPASDSDVEARVVNCGLWTIESKTGPGKPYKMTVANIECRPIFKFIDDNGVYRLFEISLTFFGSNYAEMQQALIGKYNRPNEQYVEKMRTEMGNLFPMTNLIWDNGVSKIRLSNADGTNTSVSKLRFIHRQLFLAYAKRISEQKDLPAKRREQDL